MREALAEAEKAGAAALAEAQASLLSHHTPTFVPHTPILISSASSFFFHLSKPSWSSQAHFSRVHRNSYT